MISIIVCGMADARAHLFTVKDTPRLPRELWDRFRQTAEANGEHTIDALRRALDLYIEDQRPQP